MLRPKGVDRTTIALFWQASLLEKRLLLQSILYPIGAICITTLAPLFIGKTIAALTQPTGDPMRYIPYFIAVAIIGLAANRLGFAYLLGFQAKVMSHLQSQAMRVLLRRSMGFHNNNVGGKLVSDAIDFPGAFSTLAGSFFTNLIPFVLIIVVGVGVIAAESWILGLVIVVMASYALGSGILESSKRSPIRRKRQAVSKKVTGHIADTVVNIQTVKTFAKEESELNYNEKLNHQLRDLRVKDWGSAARMGNTRLMVLMALQLIFVLVVIRLVQNDPNLLGIGIFAFSFTITISNKLFEINSLMRGIEDSLLLASTMTEIIMEDPEINDAPGSKALHVSKGKIQFRDVDFHYQDSSSHDEVFTKLNLDIRAGEKIGLVGPSGGGKSTLTRLLLRFEDITGGTIVIDTQDISHITQASLREAISYVPQEPLLFHRSIRENIAYGMPAADDAAVERAARLAHAEGFIKNLPEGYHTIVGERGVKLSGGQRQRIAIARAILKDAPILVLDEATSALDSESEVLIQDALWKLMQGRTTIVIAHRLSTIQKMDRIVVLKDGAIAEEGTHSQLIKAKGTYASLWAHQSGGFLEDE